MISAFVFEESIDIHAFPQDYVVEDAINQLKTYGVRFARTSGERCEIFEEAFDQCMGRECIVNALGLSDNEVIFVVREASYSTDIVYLDDNEVLANDLKRFLPSDEYDVDQTTDDTSRLNVNDNNDFSGDVKGRNNEGSDDVSRDEPENRTDGDSGNETTDEPREIPDERPNEEPNEQPTEKPEEIPDPPRGNDDDKESFDKNNE